MTYIGCVSKYLRLREKVDTFSDNVQTVLLNHFRCFSRVGGVSFGGFKPPPFNAYPIFNVLKYRNLYKSKVEPRLC